MVLVWATLLPVAHDTFTLDTTLLSGVLTIPKGTRRQYLPKFNFITEISSEDDTGGPYPGYLQIPTHMFYRTSFGTVVSPLTTERNTTTLDILTATLALPEYSYPGNTFGTPAQWEVYIPKTNNIATVTAKIGGGPAEDVNTVISSFDTPITTHFVNPIPEAQAAKFDVILIRAETSFNVGDNRWEYTPHPIKGKHFKTCTALVYFDQ
jgi:hypothetical protein